MNLFKRLRLTLGSALVFATVIQFPVSLFAQCLSGNNISYDARIYQPVPDALNQLLVRIHLHVIRKDDTSGGLSDTQIENSLDILNGHFVAANIKFVLVGIDNIDNTTYHDGPAKDIHTQVSEHNTSAVNIYLFPDPNVNMPGGTGGEPGQNLAIWLSQNASQRAAISHEMGHILWLFHTNRACTEFPNTCTGNLYNKTCGDYVDDTGCNTNDPNNIMGKSGRYYVDLTETFTGGQIERMRQALLGAGFGPGANPPQALVFVAALQNPTDPLIVNTPIERNATFSYNGTLQVNSVITSTPVAAAVHLRASGGIELLPGFESAPGLIAEIVPSNSLRLATLEDSAPAAPLLPTVEPIIADEVLSSYPNPANPSATVVYTVRRAGQRVRVSVYNTLGQEVTRLVDGARPVGIHHARWDGRTDGGDPVTSGVYIVRVVTEDGARTRRLTLLR